MTRNARRWTAGRAIAWLEICDPRLLRAGHELAEVSLPAAVTGAFRRGKHLVVTSDRVDIAFHFRMTGKLVAGEGEGRIRARLHLDDGSSIAFKDSRRLGELRVFESGGGRTWLDGLGLGPEPYPECHDGGWWRDRFAGVRSPIKPALLQQHRVAGLGNIVASEVCWQAKIDPRNATAQLCAAQWERLARAVPAVLTSIIDAETSDEITYLGEGRGDPTGVFAVYGRADEPCNRCGSPIVAIRQSGRSTFFCDRCV